MTMPLERAVFFVWILGVKFANTQGMSKRVAIYPGTFDPITKGHLHLIERASKIVDRLVVGVAGQSGKEPLFDLNQRVEMVSSDVKSIDSNGCQLEVKAFDTLLIDFARAENANIIFRGLRAVSDFEYEFQMTGMNARLAPEIETVFLMASDNWQFVSSSFIKEIMRLNGDVSSFLTDNAEAKLREALGLSSN